MALALADTPSYYGVPIYAEEMVFVIDVSGSMNGPRLDAAKRELCLAIGNLRPETEFAIVIYNAKVGIFRDTLIPANDFNKQTAFAFVQSLKAENRTASFDAAGSGLRIRRRGDLLFCPTDPNFGKVSNPADIVNIVTAANRVRRESIYTIGIATHPGTAQDAFMSTLAAKNYGLYQRVNRLKRPDFGHSSRPDVLVVLRRPPGCGMIGNR